METINKETGEVTETMEATGGMIYGKMADIMTDITPIAKEGRNTQQNYNFRGIDQIYNALHDIMAKHRVVCFPSVVPGSERWEERKSHSGGVLICSLMNIKYTFFAEDGSHVSATTRGEAMDSGDKATNKAMSAAHKYALVQVFMLETKENIDTENYEPSPAPRNTQPPPQPAPSRPAPTAPARPAPPAPPARQQAPPPLPANKTQYRINGEAETHPDYDLTNIPPHAPPCPTCGGEMYDNIGGQFWGNGFTEKGTKRPPFTCKDKTCKNSKGFRTHIFADTYDAGTLPDSYYASPAENPKNAPPAPAATEAELPDQSQVVDLEALALSKWGPGAWEDGLKQMSQILTGSEDYLVANSESLNKIQEMVEAVAPGFSGAK